MQILHRFPPKFKPRYSVDLPWFNSRVDTTNELLRKSSLPHMNFWKHKELFLPECSSVALSSDGVHLNSLGYIKFFKNVRAAVITANKHLQMSNP